MNSFFYKGQMIGSPHGKSSLLAMTATTPEESPMGCRPIKPPGLDYFLDGPRIVCIPLMVVDSTILWYVVKIGSTRRSYIVKMVGVESVFITGGTVANITG